MNLSATRLILHPYRMAHTYQTHTRPISDPYSSPVQYLLLNEHWMVPKEAISISFSLFPSFCSPSKMAVRVRLFLLDYLSIIAYNSFNMKIQNLSSYNLMKGFKVFGFRLLISCIFLYVSIRFLIKIPYVSTSAASWVESQNRKLWIQN